MRRAPSRRAPRPLSHALTGVLPRLRPDTVLARVQALWPEVVGPTVARSAEAVSERGGVLTVGCDSAVWAQELDLMGPDILARLNERLEGAPLVRLRCRAGGS